MTTEKPNDLARIEYWQSSMDAAYEFMTEIMNQPVQECTEPLIELKDVAAEAKVEVEFSTTKLGDKFERIFCLRQGLAANFVTVAKEMNNRGWVLKVEDAYRTIAMQKQLGQNPKLFDAILERVIWELNGKEPTEDLLFRRLSALIATCPKIGTHTSASALDISVLDSQTRNEIDRGAPYLEMSELTPMASPFVSEQAQKNRGEITAMMAKHGFAAYPWEFWHYSSGDAYDQFLNKTGKTARYGSVKLVSKGSLNVEPVEQPQKPLQEPEEFRETIQKALARAVR